LGDVELAVLVGDEAEVAATPVSAALSQVAWSNSAAHWRKLGSMVA